MNSEKEILENSVKSKENTKSQKIMPYKEFCNTIASGISSLREENGKEITFLYNDIKSDGYNMANKKVVAGPFYEAGGMYTYIEGEKEASRESAIASDAFLDMFFKADLLSVSGMTLKEVVASIRNGLADREWFQMKPDDIRAFDARLALELQDSGIDAEGWLADEATVKSLESKISERIKIGRENRTQEFASKMAEYTRNWDKYTRRTNPKLWQKGMNALKGTDFFAEAKSDPKYADLADDDNLVLSEVHARFCGEIMRAVRKRIMEECGELRSIDWDTESRAYALAFAKEKYPENHFIQEMEINDIKKDVVEFFAAPFKDVINGKDISLQEEKPVEVVQSKSVLQAKLLKEEKGKNMEKETVILDSSDESTKKIQNDLADSYSVKTAKKISGEVYESWNTDKTKFAIYADKNNKSKGVAFSRDIAEIILSHKEPDVTDWEDAVADEINKKYPKIDKSYVKLGIEPLRMGFRNGKKETVMILPDSMGLDIEKYVHSDEFISKFGDWEKAARLEKLRNAKTLEKDGKVLIGGKDVSEQIQNSRASNNMKALRDLAKEIGRTIKGTYHNKDLNTDVSLSMSNIDEIKNHHMAMSGHLEAIQYIPEIIENGIFIAEEPNEDKSKHPNIEKYQYLVTGIKIAGDNYTCKSALGVDKEGRRYYDQRLSQIEKGLLLDNLSQLMSRGKSAQSLLNYDKRLVRICQCPQALYLDENLNPTAETVKAVKDGKLYVEKDENGIQILHDENKGILIGKELSDAFQYKEKNMQKMETEIKNNESITIEPKDAISEFDQRPEWTDSEEQNSRQLFSGREESYEQLKEYLNKFEKYKNFSTGDAENILNYMHNFTTNDGNRNFNVYVSKDKSAIFAAKAFKPVRKITADDLMNIAQANMESHLPKKINPDRFGKENLKQLHKLFPSNKKISDAYRNAYPPSQQPTLFDFAEEEKNQASRSLRTNTKIKVDFAEKADWKNENGEAIEFFIEENDFYNGIHVGLQKNYDGHGTYDDSDNSFHGYAIGRNLRTIPILQAMAHPDGEHIKLLTDSEREQFDLIMRDINPEYKKAYENKLEQEKRDREANAGKNATDFVLEKLKQAGIEVVTDKDEFNRILKSANRLQKMTEDLSEYEKLFEKVNEEKVKTQSISSEKKSLEETKEENARKNYDELLSFVEQTRKFIPEEKINTSSSPNEIRNKIPLIKNKEGKVSWWIANQGSQVVAITADNTRRTLYVDFSDYEELRHYVSFNSKYEGCRLNDSALLDSYKKNLKTYLEQRITIEQQKQNRMLGEIGQLKTELAKNSTDGSSLASDFERLDKSLRFNSNFEIESAGLGEKVSVFPGSTGKSGLGIRHIIEERFKKDNLSTDEITALSGLILDSVRNGKTTRESDYQAEFTKNGIVAIVRKNFYGERENWLLTGFAFDESDLNKNREASEAIKTVIANYGNSDGYSYFRSQVGAVIASLDSNISQNQDKSIVQKLSLASGRENVYGFAYEGKIYLNPDVLNSDVAVHEYTHLWDEYTRRTNPELWHKGMNILKDTKLFAEVKNDPNYADISGDDNLVLSEVHARICGNLAQKYLERIAKEDGEIKSISAREWNNEVAEYVKNELFPGREIYYQRYNTRRINENEIDGDAIERFLETPMVDLAKGLSLKNRDFKARYENGEFTEIFHRLSDINFKTLVYKTMPKEEKEKEYEKLWSELFPDGEPLEIKAKRASWHQRIKEYESGLKSPETIEKAKAQAKEMPAETIKERLERYQKDEHGYNPKTKEEAAERNEAKFKDDILNTLGRQHGRDYDRLLDWDNVFVWNTTEPVSTIATELRISILRNELKERGLLKEEDKTMAKEISENNVESRRMPYKEGQEARAQERYDKMAEYMRKWDKYTRRTNPELWQKGMNALKKTDFFKEIKSDPKYADIADDDNLVFSEVHARICGDIMRNVRRSIIEKGGELRSIDWDAEYRAYVVAFAKEKYPENRFIQEIEMSDIKKDGADFFATSFKDFISEKNISLQEEKPLKDAQSKSVLQAEPLKEQKDIEETAEIERLYAEVNPNGGNDRGFQFGVKDLEHLRNVKQLLDDFEKNPPKHSELSDLEKSERRYSRESKRLQKIYEKERDKEALKGAQENADYALFYHWQTEKLRKDIVQNPKKWESVGEWYKMAYPSDAEMGDEIAHEVTFDDFEKAVKDGRFQKNENQRYGSQDSVVRERIFQKISEMNGQDYSVIYNEWLKADEKNAPLPAKKESTANSILNSQGDVSTEVRKEGKKFLNELYKEIEQNPIVFPFLIDGEIDTESKDKNFELAMAKTLAHVTKSSDNPQKTKENIGKYLSLEIKEKTKIKESLEKTLLQMKGRKIERKQKRSMAMERG